MATQKVPHVIQIIIIIIKVFNLRNGRHQKCSIESIICKQGIGILITKDTIKLAKTLAVWSEVGPFTRHNKNRHIETSYVKTELYYIH